MLTSAPQSNTARVVAALYTLLGLSFFALLTATILAQPLFPFRMDDVGWTSSWLLTTIADYYTAALCLCGVIVATDGRIYGILWTLAICVLGSPFACLWLVLRLWSFHTLQCADSFDGSNKSGTRSLRPISQTVMGAIAFYALLGLSFFALLTATILAQPLFPFRMDDVGWTSSWLLTTIADYYTAALCLCGVIVATDGRIYGILWTLAICVLGSPFACLWLAARVWTHKAGLTLLGTANDAVTLLR